MPIISRIADKTNLKEFVESSSDNPQEAGEQFFAHIFMKHGDVIGDDVCMLVSQFEDKPLEDIESQDILETMKTVGTIFKDAQVMTFFGLAMR